MASILIIDDDEAVRTLVRIILENSGHAVREAVSGKAGIDAYRQQPADVVLCDMLMPGMDGVETTRQLREEFPAAKVVLLTGGSPLSTSGMLEQAQPLGALALVGKPISRELLTTVIEGALQATAPAGEPQDRADALPTIESPKCFRCGVPIDIRTGWRTASALVVRCGNCGTENTLTRHGQDERP